MCTASRYNYWLDESDGRTLVNLLTDAAVEVDEVNLHAVEAILQNPDQHTGTEIFNTLLDSGFIVDSDFDELLYLKLRHIGARYGTERLGLSILPTLRCNLRCVYCFEEHLDLDMDEETQSRLLRFIEGKLQAKRGLYVSWFGGEPLLRLDLIRSMSARILRLCEESKSEFSAQITSNGFLLTRPVAEELVELCVRFAQITLDGPQGTHDSRRVLPSGAGTYAQILRNILDAAHALQIRIRVNLDAETVTRAEELMDDLAPVRENVALGFYPVRQTPNADQNDLKCMSLREFAPFSRLLQQEALRRGFRLVTDYGLPGTVHCGAYQLDTHVVDPRGDVFMCVENVGRREMRKGYLTAEGKLEYIYPRLLPWTTWSPFDDEACVACVALPVCMGGCIRLKDADLEERCIFKHGFEQRIRSRIGAPDRPAEKEVKS